MDKKVAFVSFQVLAGNACELPWPRPSALQRCVGCRPSCPRPSTPSLRCQSRHSLFPSKSWTGLWFTWKHASFSGMQRFGLNWLKVIRNSVDDSKDVNFYELYQGLTLDVIGNFFHMVWQLFQIHIYRARRLIGSPWADINVITIYEWKQ